MSLFAEIRRYESTQWGLVKAIIDMGDHEPETAPPFFYVDLTGADPFPSPGWFYDSQAGTFQEAEPAGLPSPPLKITAERFWLQLLENNERAKVWALKNGVQLPGVSITDPVLWRMASWVDINTDGTIDLNDDETQWLVNGLETGGVIAAGRAATILANLTP